MNYRLVKLRHAAEGLHYSYRMEFNDLNEVADVCRLMHKYKIEHSRVGFSIWIKERDYTWFALRWQ